MVNFKNSVLVHLAFVSSFSGSRWTLLGEEDPEGRGIHARVRGGGRMEEKLEAGVRGGLRKERSSEGRGEGEREACDPASPGAVGAMGGSEGRRATVG